MLLLCARTLNHISCLAGFWIGCALYAEIELYETTKNLFFQCVAFFVEFVLFCFSSLDVWCAVSTGLEVNASNNVFYYTISSLNRRYLIRTERMSVCVRVSARARMDVCEYVSVDRAFLSFSHQSPF